MNHKPGSVANLTVGVGVSRNKSSRKLQDWLGKAISDCHLSWDSLAAGLLAVYPQHWTGRPAAA